MKKPGVNYIISHKYLNYKHFLSFDAGRRKRLGPQSGIPLRTLAEIELPTPWLNASAEPRLRLADKTNRLNLAARAIGFRTGKHHDLISAARTFVAQLTDFEKALNIRGLVEVNKGDQP